MYKGHMPIPNLSANPLFINAVSVVGRSIVYRYITQYSSTKHGRDQIWVFKYNSV